MYSTLSNFSSLVDAFNLKIGLLEADEHQRPDFLRNKPTASEMIFGKGKEIDVSLPIYDQDQKVFAKSYIKGKKNAPTVNSSVRMGTLIKYDTEEQYPTYGIVTPPPPFTKDKGVYVQSISASEASSMKEKDKNIPEMSIGKGSLKNVKKLREGIVRRKRGDALYNFFYANGTFNFLDGVSFIEFVTMFAIFTIFFVSVGMLYILLT